MHDMSIPSGMPSFDCLIRYPIVASYAKVVSYGDPTISGSSCLLICRRKPHFHCKPILWMIVSYISS